MIEYIVILIVGLALGAGVGLMLKGKSAEGRVKGAEAQAAKIVANAEREAEAKRVSPVIQGGFRT